MLVYQRVPEGIQSDHFPTLTTFRRFGDSDAMARQAGIPWKERRASDPWIAAIFIREDDEREALAPLLLFIHPNEPMNINEL